MGARRDLVSDDGGPPSQNVFNVEITPGMLQGKERPRLGVVGRPGTSMTQRQGTEMR